MLHPKNSFVTFSAIMAEYLIFLMEMSFFSVLERQFILHG